MLDLKFTARTLEKDLSFIRRYFKVKLDVGYGRARELGILIREIIDYCDGTAKEYDYDTHEYVMLHNLNDWLYYYVEH